MGFKEARQARQEHKRTNFGLGLLIKVKDGEIIYKRKHYPLAGAHATVDNVGEIDKRITATRLILTGPFALGLRKKKDTRELFLLVEGDGFGFVVELPPSLQMAAREFAMKLNVAAGA